MNAISYMFSTSTPEPKSPERLERELPAARGRRMGRMGRAALVLAVVLSLIAGPLAAMADVTDVNGGPEWGVGDVIGGGKDFIEGAVGDAIAPALGALTDTLSDIFGFSDVLREAVNNNLANTTQALRDMTGGSALTKSLSEQNPSAYTWLKALHKSAAIPLANVVLLVFMVVGLGKVIAHAGRTESGVDLWQLVMVFIAYSFAKTIIDASWELMEFAYDIVRQYIMFTFQQGVSTWNSTPPAASDDIKNTGALLTMWIISLVTWLAATLCGMIANVVVIVRTIQIYVYTALAPISLGTLVAEGGRQMATGFLKRYAALLLAGLLMAVLFVLFGLMIQSQVLPAVPTEADKVAQWSVTMFEKIGWAVAFAYCLFKSGAWARDFVGV